VRRVELLVGIAVLLGVLGLFAWRPQLVDRLEYQLHDWRFRIRGPQPTSNLVAIVAIDAKSVDELGRWPWRRSVIADLVERLADAGAAAVGFDVVFSEPETPPEVEPLREAVAELAGGNPKVVGVLDRAIEAADTDTRLETAFRSNDHVVAGYFFRSALDTAVEGGGTIDLPLEEALPMIRKSRLQTGRLPDAIAETPMLGCVSVEPNLPRFNSAARRMGFFNARPDVDGVIRRTSLVARCGDDFYKALSLSMLELYLGQKALLVWDHQQGLVSELKLGDSRIPLDEAGRILVNYRGPPQTFPHYSAVDIIRGRVADEELAGRLLLVGTTEIGIGDVRPSPFAEVAPGVEVHATALDNMLTGEILTRRDSLIVMELVAVALLALLLIVAVPLLDSAVRSAAFAALLAGIVATLGVWAFLEFGWMVNLAFPLLAVGIPYVAMAVTHGSAEEAEARFIRDSFDQFVPPDVVNEMIDHPELFVMGGQRKDLSLLFSDIRSFTSISEDLGPDHTTRLLNAYLTPMTQIVFESRGTLDKYIGDAVVAFWNAPLDVPDHPLRAAEAAVAMQEATRAMREGRGDLRGADRLRIGIGIHAAEVNVGKMGSDLRVDYTVTGDGVNLCARLEGMTKQYGAGIVTSHELVARLPEGFLLRELDAIRVKGRSEPVQICEILGRRGPEAGEKDWLDAYGAGLEAYRRGDWAEAERSFGEAREIHQGDRACDLLLDRIASLRTNPPSDWDGIWTFETK
jgi:adenylate cyclase